MELMTGRLLYQTIGVLEIVNTARGTLAGWSDEKAWRTVRYLRRIARIAQTNEGSLLFEKKPNRKATYLSKLTQPQQTALEILYLVFVKFADDVRILEAGLRLEKQLAPRRHDAKVGRDRIRQLQKFGFGSHPEDQEKHEQWRKFQAVETASNSNFSRQSKQEQAKRLKKKYSIPNKPTTIAKRLEPLPDRKKK